ncbi:MAG: hypothetical protein ABR972_14475, partial [Acidimicrobiales bacterium]
MSTGPELGERPQAPPLVGAGHLQASSVASAKPVWRGRIAIAVVIAIYLCLGVMANLPSWTGGVTHTMQCGGCGDSGQEVWFLAWGAHALTHLQNPLRTNWLNYPWGVDLADNTS